MPKIEKLGMDKILEEVRRRSFPDKADRERIRTTVAGLLENTRDIIDDPDAGIKVEIGGSTAKDTYLKGADIDLFLLFPREVSEEEAARMCFDIGKNILDEHLVQYASHPYLSGTLNGVGVDVVWAYEVASGAEIVSAVDRTPFHTRFVNERLDKDHTDEVRFLKRFLEGIGIYSASLRVRGVSGYLTELLVVKYGGFTRVLRSVAGWSKRTWLELGEGEGEGNGAGGEKKRFPGDALVFIDPVDENRNVAAALSRENYFRFVAAAKAFLTEPDPDFFYPPSLPEMGISALMRQMERRGTALLSVTIPCPAVVDDILYPQIHKADRALRTLLVEKGFGVIGSGVVVRGPGLGERGEKDKGCKGCKGSKRSKESKEDNDRITFLFEIDRERLPPAKIHAGPPTNIRSAGDFLGKWTGSEEALSLPWISGERWHVLRKRKETDVRKVVENNLHRLGLGKDIDKELERGFSVLTGSEAVTAENAEGLLNLLIRGEPWLHGRIGRREDRWTP